MSLLRKRDARAEHRYVEERLSAYLDGELSSRDRAVVDRHLARCQHCRWNLKTLRQTIQWTRSLPSVPVPRAFTIPVQSKPVPVPRWRWSMPLLQGATALVAVLFFLAVAGNAYLARPAPASQPPAEVAVEEARADARVPEVTAEEEMLIEAEPLAEAETEVSDAAAAPPVSVVEEQVAEYQAEKPAAVPPSGTGGVETRALEAGEDLNVEAAETEPEVAAAEGEAEQEVTSEKPAPGPPTEELSPTQEPSAPVPTVVAEVSMAEAEPAVDKVSETASGAAQERKLAWLSIAEIALGLAFVLLGTITIFLMVRRIRAS